MMRFLLATTAVLCAGPVYAADMPMKAPPRAPAAALSWTSCYLGGHVGLGWGHTTLVDPNTTFGGLFAPAGSPVGVDQGPGALGGGQIGCDYQFANNWVIGAAGDFSFADIDGSSQDPFFAGKNNNPVTRQDRTEWLATATGRLGYAFDHWLVYGKGGAAWTRNAYTLSNLADWGTPTSPCSTGALFIACNPTGKNTQAGWTAGLGVAYAISSAWSAGIEFDYYDFGKRTTLLADPNVVGLVVPANPAAPITASHQVEAIKFTLDYHFGQPSYR